MSKQEVINPASAGLEKAVNYFQQNKKSLTIIGGAIVVLIAAFFAYINFYKAPREQKAAKAIWKAQYYFEIDSFATALNGDGEYLGFKEIADNYSGTETGNLANYYAGMCYMHLGDYNNAIKYLEEFSSDDEMLMSLAHGAAGDAYMELGNVEKAISKYEKAIDNSDNNYTTPRFLKKAALALELQGKFDKAAKYYERILNDYEVSSEAKDIEKYIERAKNSEVAR
jgi:tetratricopeptide (TPR) repeat protein